MVHSAALITSIQSRRRVKGFTPHFRKIRFKHAAIFGAGSVRDVALRASSSVVFTQENVQAIEDASVQYFSQA
jgi:hypothetical protein